MSKSSVIPVNTKIADTRNLINDLFKTQEDFRAFLADFLMKHQRSISEKISYNEQITELLTAESCSLVLQQLRGAVEGMYASDPSTEEQYHSYCDRIARIMEFSEPTIPIVLMQRPLWKRIKDFFRKILVVLGVLWLIETIRWIWSRIKDFNIDINGGTIVIVGVTGGVFSLTIYSCKDRAAHNLPTSPHPENSNGVMILRRTENFCSRQVSVVEEGAANSPAPGSLESKLRKLENFQFLHNLNNILRSKAPLDPSKLNQNSGAPSASMNIDQSSLPMCADSQQDRLGVDFQFKWRKKSEREIKICPDGRACTDLKFITASCEFSYSIVDPNSAYNCSFPSHTIKSLDFSYLEPPVVFPIPPTSDIQARQMAAADRFQLLLDNCEGAMSAVALLGSCHHR